MKTRVAVLKRLEAMYGLVEELHSVALRQVAATVHEAEAAIAVQTVRVREARSAGCAAFGSGDRETWAVAEVQRGMAGEKCDRLEVVRVLRETEAALARETYMKSHLQREQMKSVVESAVKAEQTVEGRRMQEAADDRFLSRLHWNRLRFEAI